MAFTDRKPWTITEKDVATKWGLAGGKLACYLCGKVAEVGDTFRWLYMNGASPSPGNVMCCAGCDHVGIEDEIRAALVAWQRDFPGCNYEIRPAMKLADLERRLAEAQRDGERLDKLEALKKPGQRWMIHDWTFHKDITAYVGVWHGESYPGKSHETLREAIDDAARKEGV